MEEMIETRAEPRQVWAAWERAHALPGHKEIEPGPRKKDKFKYKISDVKKGESFSIIWKALFVRVVFTHEVKRSPLGSLIRYQMDIRGLLAWPVRWIIKDKIKANLNAVLKSTVEQLEATS